MNGIPSEEDEYKYMASLQLIKIHICSAGLFQNGFLLTTAMCAHYIGKHIEQRNQRATVVLGDLSLKNGQRIDIWKIAYYKTFENHDYEFGVIMVGQIEILNFLNQLTANCTWRDKKITRILILSESVFIL